MKFPVKKLISLGFVVSVLALSLTGWLSYRLTRRATATLETVAHTQEVIGKLVAVNASLREVESVQRGFLLTGAVGFLADRTNAIKELDTQLAELRALTRDNQNHQRALGKLEPLIVERLNLADDRIVIFQQSGLAAATKFAPGASEAFMSKIKLVLSEMRAEENQLLLQREEEAQKSSQRSLRIIMLSSGLAILIGLLAVLVIYDDLRQRELSARELQESRSLLEAILNHTPAVVFIKDLAGRYLFVNQRFEHIAGRSRADIQGKTAAEIFPVDQAETAAIHQQTVFTKQAPVEFDEIVLYPDGPRQHRAVKFPLRDAAGKIYALAGISSDVTERKKAEEERDRFFTLSLDLLCIASSDGYFKRVSPAVTDILGWSMAEFLARPFLDFVHPDDHAPTLQAVARQVQAGQRVLQFENRYRHKDGSWRVLSWCSMPHLELMYAIARDVTREKAAAAQIVQLNTALQSRAGQLEAANKELEAFSYSVSHDLRAPLRHIDGFVDLLAKQNSDKLDDHGKRYLKIITNAARQMSSLIDDLLVFSRMGRAEMRRQAVDLNALAHEAIASLQADLTGRKVTWKIATLPPVKADAAMLRQVLVNLIANAIKYSRPRNPAIIEIGCASETPEEFQFFVRDNGVGFDMEYVDKLFGVFQRLHRSEEFEGTGIGLANVRRIILRHGGRAWAEGKVDAGATFHFTLPKSPED